MKILDIFTCLALLMIFPGETAYTVNGKTQTVRENRHVEGGIQVIGAIVDNTSRIGKEEQTAMEMAVLDFNVYNDQTLVLHIRNSERVPVKAALAAMDLINKQHAQVILGPQTWEEVSVVAQIGNERNIPVLSLAESTPEWATERWPFLVSASPNRFTEMKAIASIVQSWEWKQVTVIYEDFDSSASGVVPHLSDALREKGAEIINVLALPPFASSTLPEELRRLQEGQCRVFVVHLSMPMAVRLFEMAKQMKMMEEGYVWITTDAFTSLVHSIDGSTITLVQGILGVQRYFPENGSRFRDFYKRFRKRFSFKYPDEDILWPGFHAVQAYDAVWTVCRAMKESKKWSKGLLEKILLSDFQGLTSEVQFVNQKIVPAHMFQIINVMKGSYKEIGFWSNEFGFQVTLNNSTKYNPSMEGFGQVFWPGGPSDTAPKGWALGDKPLRIGVPTRSIFKEYVKVEYDLLKNETSFSGLSIKLFEAIVKELPLPLPFEFFAFNDTYTQLVKQIPLKNFDAAVGDIAITTTRYQYAEFTPPYTESGLVMIVPLQSKSHSKEWLFIKPFTKALWILIASLTIYNGFVIWLIERNHFCEPTASPLNQTGSWLCFSFVTLFSVQGSILHSNLSRMTMVVWLFVALVITQTYTANLASILTAKRLPTASTVETLQKNNALVGFSNASFVARYLLDVLHFNAKNIRGYTNPDGYARDLNNGEIAAIFLEVPVAKFFLARYCKHFTMVGPTYKVGGYGFAFPKGSLLLPSITEALLNVSEKGTLQDLESKVFASQKCVEVDLNDQEISSLSVRSFHVLFLLTGATSTTALIIYVSHYNWKIKVHQSFNILHKSVWTIMLVLTKHWENHRRVQRVESPREIVIVKAEMGIVYI